MSQYSLQVKIYNVIKLQFGQIKIIYYLKKSIYYVKCTDYAKV